MARIIEWQIRRRAPFRRPWMSTTLSASTAALAVPARMDRQPGAGARQGKGDGRLIRRAPVTRAVDWPGESDRGFGRRLRSGRRTTRLQALPPAFQPRRTPGWAIEPPMVRPPTER